MRSGRPLRFLVLALGGWTTMRAVALWQPALSVPLARSPSPGSPSLPPEPFDTLRWLHDPVDHDAIAPWVVMPSPRSARPRWSAIARAVSVIGRSSAPPAGAGQAGAHPTPALPPRPGSGAIPPPLRPTPIAAHRSRLAGSAWLIARSGGAGTGLSLLGGQLGASQTGARITYALGEARRVALSARIATPFEGKGREAAFGLDWQPTRAPVHLIAEERVSLDGGHGGPTLLVVGGIGPTPIVAGLRLEAYAQAGAIARRAADGGVEGFGDGAARLTRPVAALGPLRLDLGAGAWGAIQRGAQRLDIGPTLGVVVPLGHGAHYRAVRLTADWRERVGGAARPGSGPALSLGADF